MAQQPRPLNPAASPKALFGAQLRLLREAAGHSQSSLGMLVFASSDAVATWEKGRSIPADRDTVARIEHELDGRGLLLAAYDLAARPDADKHADTRGSAPRETWTHGSIGAMTPPTDDIDEAAREAAAFGAFTEQIAGIGPVALEMINQEVRTLSGAALTVPPTLIIKHAAPLARHVYTLARDRQRPTQARELHRLASQLCSIMSWIAGDIGRLKEAELYATTALACAQIADEPETTAWAHIVGSKTAFWRRDYAVAAERARRGTAAGATGTATVMLACQRADAYSKLGDSARVIETLRAIDDAVTQAGPDQIGGLLSCGPARAGNYAAAALLATGQSRPALARATDALEHAAAEGVGFGTVAQTHLTRALAYADLGDPEAAADAARPVLELEPARRLATLTDRLAPLAPRLEAAPGAARAHAELAEEIRAYCSTTHTAPRIAPLEEN